MEYDAELSSFFHIEFVKDDGSIFEEVLWAVIEHDYKGRFKKNRVIITSSVIKVVDYGEDRYVFTRNSIYKMNKNSGEKITIPFNYLNFSLIQRGYSPLIIRQYYLENEHNPLITNNPIYPENIH